MHVALESGDHADFQPGAFRGLSDCWEQPDPTDLPRRSHVYRCLGDPNRRTTRFPEILMGWLQRRYLDIDVEEPLASRRGRAARRSNAGSRTSRTTTKPGLRVLRRANRTEEPVGYRLLENHPEGS
jgi:hypothetical protein